MSTCRLRAVLLACAVWGLASQRGRGDIVEYIVPGLDIIVSLQGKTTVNPGRTVTFTHPSLGHKLTMGLDDVRIFKAPTFQEVFSQRLNKAVAARDADEVMRVAQFALKHGLLREVYSAADKALEIKPDHAAALRVRRLRELMAQPLGSYEQQERHLRQVCRNDGMKIRASEHFILLYDVPDEGPKPRSLRRLELLEQVYSVFLLKFHLHGATIDIPRERMMVLLFHQHSEFLQFGAELDPELTSASGFWDHRTNVAVFFDHGTSDRMRRLMVFSDKLQQDKAEAIRTRSPGAREIVRMADTMRLIIEIEREDLDITVVTHECAHQMAGNTGLLPRDIRIPSWAHEGLATYFESPDDASWSGIGAVNQERLQYYKFLTLLPEYSKVEFLVSDRIFRSAKSHEATLAAYGQAWAMTHYLMDKQFPKLVEYYARLGELPPDLILTPEINERVFFEVFGEPDKVNAQFRAYMRSIKTDLELLIDLLTGG